jgi:hypothetical protein
MLSIVTGVVWSFLNVAVFAALVTPATSLPKDSVAGVNVACAHADELRTSRQSKRRIPPKSTLLPFLAGLALELRKQPER